MKRKTFFIVYLCLVSNSFFAQNGVSNYYEIRDSFYKKWNNFSNEEQLNRKNEYKQFEKWDWYWKPKVDNPSINGNFKIFYEQLANSYKSLASRQGTPNQSQFLAWNYIGPVQSNPSDPYFTGRITVTDFHPNYNGLVTVGTTPNPDLGQNTLYAGSPTGGLFISTNGGKNWSDYQTGSLPFCGIVDFVNSDMIGNNNNNYNMYIATRNTDVGIDNMGKDNYTSMIYKRTASASNWQPSGAPFNGNAFLLNGTILKIHDLNLKQPATSLSHTVYCASTLGLHFSFDKGITWQQATINSPNSQDFPVGPTQIEFRRTGAGGYYLGSNWGDWVSGGAQRDIDTIYRSTNGLTFNAWQKISKEMMGSQGGLYLLEQSYSTPTNADRFWISGYKIYTANSNTNVLYLKVNLFVKSCSDAVILSANPRTKFPSPACCNSTNCNYIKEAVTIFISTNQGGTWQFLTSLPNNPGLTGVYSFAIDATDHNITYLGGGNNDMRKMVYNPMQPVSSTNPLITNIQGRDWAGGSNNYHADQRVIKSNQVNTSTSHTLFGTDGGINVTYDKMLTVKNINGDGLSTTQLYEIGTSTTNEKKILAAAQDNQIYEKDANNGTWTHKYSNTLHYGIGDGCSTGINPNDDNNFLVYDGQNGGSNNRIYNGSSFTPININSNCNSFSWNLPYSFIPSMNTAYQGKLFVGSSAMYRSDTKGTSASWQLLGGYNIPSGNHGCGSPKITKIAVLANNPDYIAYTTRWPVNISGINHCGIYYTKNGGSTWNNLWDQCGTKTALHFVGTPLANRLYVGYGGYDVNMKVGYYNNLSGSINWINNGLPNFPIYCLEIDNQTGYLFAGTDVGVYYTNPNLTNPTWSLLGVSLPNVPVTSIQVFNPTKKLRVSTFGRGVWEIDISNL